MSAFIIPAGITIVTVFCMELVAWLAHKYLMHGFLWVWHEDHHQPEVESDKFFQKNDLFFLVFAIPSAASYIIGLSTPYIGLLYVGIGISIYGGIYFLIHDVYIHQRFSWFKHLDNRYSRAILRAHGAHHAHTGKEAGESFGLLLVSAKYFLKRTR
jgi:beta-carotene 3-hydroxylase